MSERIGFAGAQALDLPGWRHVYSGKVRDLYEPADAAPGESDTLLVVASDRISAYDFVLEPPIPDKGAVLTPLSLWWFEQLAGTVENHVVSTDVPEAVAGRAMVVKRLDMFPVLGEHDENITFAQMTERVGAEPAARLRDLTLDVYTRAEEIARGAGIILADTKVEFGTDPATGAIVLGDEVLTPDSSRFWDAADYEPGRAQASFDKQFVRDWLTSDESGWDRASGEVPPALPADVVEKTRARYVEAYERLTGRTFAV